MRTSYCKPSRAKSCWWVNMEEYYSVYIKYEPLEISLQSLWWMCCSSSSRGRGLLLLRCAFVYGGRIFPGRIAEKRMTTTTMDWVDVAIPFFTLLLCLVQQIRFQIILCKLKPKTKILRNWCGFNWKWEIQKHVGTEDDPFSVQDDGRYHCMRVELERNGIRNGNSMNDGTKKE